MAGRTGTGAGGVTAGNNAASLNGSTSRGVSTDSNASSGYYNGDTSGFQSIIRRSEDLDCIRIQGISVSLYALALTQMVLYIIVVSLPSPPSTTSPYVIAALKALPCITLSINAALRYFMYRRNRFLLCLATAYVFHAIGDYLLVFDNLFTAGLASFLLAHTLNLVAFVSAADVDDDDEVAALHHSHPLKLRLDLAAPFALYVFAFVLLLMLVGPASPGDEKLSQDAFLSVCVVIYASVLGSCPWRSFVRYKDCYPGENRALWMIVFVGYLIYASSDSMLAIDRFVATIPEPWRSILVMATYWTGQLLISVACDVGCRKASVVNYFIDLDSDDGFRGAGGEDFERESKASLIVKTFE
jgi:uncharacterized membrane protein YhhN